MKALIGKDLRLCLHPMCYLAPLFVLMLLIPSYPCYVAFFYTTLAVFFLFLSGRENGDVLFTALLPADKTRLVRARTVTVAGLGYAVYWIQTPRGMVICIAALLILFILAWEPAEKRAETRGSESCESVTGSEPAARSDHCPA